MKARTYRKHVENKLKESLLAIANSSAAVAAPKTSPAGKVVEAIMTDLPGLLAVAVVDIDSGLALASHSNSPAINLETAATYNAEVVKQKQKAITALKLTNEKIQDILITLSNQLHLLKLSSDGTKFIYLVVNPRDTNLAVARDVLRVNTDEIN